MTETGVRADTSATAPEFRNNWLEGPFAPVDQEVAVYGLKVTGSIPGALEGRLLRVGPNPVDPENPVTYNWFTGNGMVPIGFHGNWIPDAELEQQRKAAAL
jgi:carotenoid cleavage dioxygenase-like enzyme